MRPSARDAESVQGGRRRAGSCPPEGRMATASAMSSRATLRSSGGLLAGAIGTRVPLRAGDFGIGSPMWASSIGNSITARIISTDRGGLDLSSNRPAAIPGTLQLTVLVPVLVGPPRRTETDVAGIGTTWVNGIAKQDLPDSNLLNKLEHVKEGEAALDNCGICLQPFIEGEQLTALPCATGICPSVWHEDCIRKWLCQGHMPSCPLCRSTIDVGIGGVTGSGTPTATLSSHSFALEVRAALPLSAASAAAVAGLQVSGVSRGFTARQSVRNSVEVFRNHTHLLAGGIGSSNQMLQQLGQEIIQDILLLTLSHQAGNNAPASASAAAGGAASLASHEAVQSSGGSTNPTMLSDLGGLVLRSLSANGMLPLAFSTVEPRSGELDAVFGRTHLAVPETLPSSNSAMRRSMPNRETSNGKGKGKGRGKGKGDGKGKGRNRRGGQGQSTPVDTWSGIVVDRSQSSSEVYQGSVTKQRQRRRNWCDQAKAGHSGDNMLIQESGSSASTSAPSWPSHTSTRTDTSRDFVPSDFGAGGSQFPESSSSQGGRFVKKSSGRKHWRGWTVKSKDAPTISEDTPDSTEWSRHRQSGDWSEQVQHRAAQCSSNDAHVRTSGRTISQPYWNSWSHGSRRSQASSKWYDHRRWN